MGIRKNQAALSPSERSAFIAAVKAVKAGGLYDTFVAQHRAAFLARSNDPAHNGPGFLPWHREFLLRFERALQAVDSSVSLPYWDWTVDNSPASSLWDVNFMGGDGSGRDERVTTGPFAYATGEWILTVLDPGETDPFLKRKFGGMGRLPTAQDVEDALKVEPYDRAPWHFQSAVGGGSFRGGLEGGIHNPGHMWTGGSMMAFSSPNDPVFWLHHCNIDRLWALWQQSWRQRNPGRDEYLPPSGTAGVVGGHALDDPMRPWDQEANPPTPRKVLDHRPLGYSYDTETSFGPERYNGIWDKTSADRTYVYGYAREHFDTQNANLEAQGYRLREVNAFVLPDGQGERYNAIWDKTPGDRTYVYGYAREHFDTQNANLEAQGYRLREVNAFVLPDGQGERYNAIWDKTPGDRTYVYGYAREHFDTQNANLEAQGYRFREINTFVLI